MDALAATLPIFGLIGLGWMCAKLKLLDEAVAQGLAAFVFWLAFPALLLSSTALAPPPDAQFGGMIGLWLAVLLGVQVLARLLAATLRLPAETAAGTALAASCGNTAFLGTAILASLMGPHVLGTVAAFVAVENIVVVALAVAGLRATRPEVSRLQSLRAGLAGLVNPVSLGAMVGFGLSMSGLGLHPLLARPMTMLGAAASPAALVSLGIVMALAAAQPDRTGKVSVWLAIALKTIALPLAMFSVFTLAGVTGDIRLIVTVLAACPSAVNVYIQARQAGQWAAPAAWAVTGSTLVSLLGLTLAVALA